MKINDPQQNTQFTNKAVRILTKGECLILMFWLQDSKSYICTNKELAERTNVAPQYIGRVMKSLVQKNVLIHTGHSSKYQTNIYEPNLGILSSNTPPTIKKEKKPSKVDLSVSCDKICEDKEAEKQAKSYDLLVTPDDLAGLHV